MVGKTDIYIINIMHLKIHNHIKKKATEQNEHHLNLVKTQCFQGRENVDLNRHGSC